MYALPLTQLYGVATTASRAARAANVQVWQQAGAVALRCYALRALQVHNHIYLP